MNCNYHFNERNLNPLVIKKDPQANLQFRFRFANLTSYVFLLAGHDFYNNISLQHKPKKVNVTKNVLQNHKYQEMNISFFLSFYLQVQFLGQTTKLLVKV